MDSFSDLGKLTGQELKDLVKEFTEEAMEISSNRRLMHEKIEERKTDEAEISSKRRVLHGKIDIVRAELVDRLRKEHDGGEDVGGSGSSGVRKPRRPKSAARFRRRLVTGSCVSCEDLREPPPPLLSDR